MRTSLYVACAGILLLGGCAAPGEKVYETTYVDGMYNGTAVLKAKKGGGYQTISGDPVIAVDNGLTTEDQLPYGGGEAGIREMEDSGVPAGW